MPKNFKKDKKKALEVIFGAIEQGESIEYSCTLAGVDRLTFYAWRKKNPELQARLEEIEEKGRQELLRKLKDKLLDVALGDPSGHQMKALQLYLQKLDPDFRMAPKEQPQDQAKALLNHARLMDIIHNSEYSKEGFQKTCEEWKSGGIITPREGCAPELRKNDFIRNGE